jgi:16S rRNA (guanine527-N7)-methyltransferase
VATVAERVTGLAKGVEVELAAPVANQLASYIGLLAKWDKTINLTGFELDPPSDEALNRLLIEPVAISRFLSVFGGLRSALDVGSGGGSPAIPLKVLLPQVHFTLVESRARKCAFLREALRQLDLTGVDVMNCRLEDIRIGAGLSDAVDLVSVRAVRLNHTFLDGVRRLLRPNGYFLQFGTASSASYLPADFNGVLHIDLQATDTRIRLTRLGSAAD